MSKKIHMSLQNNTYLQAKLVFLGVDHINENFALNFAYKRLSLFSTKLDCIKAKQVC